MLPCDEEYAGCEEQAGPPAATQRSIAGPWVASPAALQGDMATDRDVVLVIADISGYTRFLVSHGKAQTHGDMIVGALLREHPSCRWQTC